MYQSCSECIRVVGTSLLELEPNVEIWNLRPFASIEFNEYTFDADRIIVCSLSQLTCVIAQDLLRKGCVNLAAICWHNTFNEPSFE
jgi:hypothetical protein